MAGEEGAVGGVVLVEADGDDGDAGVFALHLEEAGELLDAGGAPGGPQVEDDSLSAESGQVGALDAVGYGELRGGFADVAGVVAALAADGEEQQQGQNRQ